MWLTDFDGTIKPKIGAVAPADLTALQRLGQESWFRVVVTGRNLFSFIKDWEPGLGLDALIFASGAGLCFWGPMGPGPLTRSYAFTDQEAQTVLQAALELDYGFFSYLALPDNHYFYYHLPAQPPDIFIQRIQQYHFLCQPWPKDFFTKNTKKVLSQVLIMVPAGQADEVEARFHQLAPGMSVIRSSSPSSSSDPDQQLWLWLEIFPKKVSKGTAAAALALDLGLTATQAVALGNDYNDQDLLEWAGNSFITSDAPPEIRLKHINILPAGQGGLAQAAEIINERSRS